MFTWELWEQGNDVAVVVAWVTCKITEKWWDRCNNFDLLWIDCDKICKIPALAYNI